MRLRLERDQPLSFLEFNYPILQAVDFVELARHFGCELQIGGSDQWGNIVGGVDLGRRTGGRALFGLTTPLIATASGAKMGKSVGGAVWLNAESCPPTVLAILAQYRGRRCRPLLRLFTELPLAEITKLGWLEGGEVNNKRSGDRSDRAVSRPGGAAAAAATAHAVFAGGGGGVSCHDRGAARSLGPRHFRL